MPDLTAKRFLLALACLASAAVPSPAAAAQSPAGEPQLVIAIPALPTAKNVKTDAGETGVIGILISQMIASDLRSSGAFMPIGHDKLRQYSPTEAGAPLYPMWSGTGAGALVTGYVQARDDG